MGKLLFILHSEGTVYSAFSNIYRETCGDIFERVSCRCWLYLLLLTLEHKSHLNTKM